MANSANIVRGGAGNDVLVGTAGEDWLIGEDGDDDLSGGDGPDTLHGGAGDDRLLGGRGNDFLFGEAGRDWLEGGDGSDQLHSTDSESDTLLGGAGDDYVEADVFDEVFGGEGVDRLTITLTTGGSYDFSVAQTGTLAFAQGGSVTGVERFFVLGSNGADSIWGGALDDTLWAGSGNDLLRGGDGDDSLAGEAGEDVLEGGGGDDRLYGVEETNGYTGSIAIPAADALRGGDGDYLVHMGLYDFADGGAGIDLIRFELGDLREFDARQLSSNTVTFSHGGSFRNFERIDAVGSGFDDRIWGGVFDDRLHGDGGDDSLSGEDGDDHLDGGRFGNDRLIGGAGNDVLEGGGGADILIGGAGDDILYGRDEELYPLSNPQAVAVFSGSSAKYNITLSPPDEGGRVVVTISGPDGHDVLHGIRLVRFDDVTIDVLSADTVIVCRPHEVAEDKAADAQVRDEGLLIAKDEVGFLHSHGLARVHAPEAFSDWLVCLP